jgi:RimJ/RimL family protein N-acetyltransferase
MTPPWPAADLTVGELYIRTLRAHDVALIVEATSGESAPSLWGPQPSGPYVERDARAALRRWDPDTSERVSFGVFDDQRMEGAVGLMLDDAGGAELAYWVRPESRGRGAATRSVRAITTWAHDVAGLARIWLEIHPDNGPSRLVAQRTGFDLELKQSDHCWIWTHIA